MKNLYDARDFAVHPFSNFRKAMRDNLIAAVSLDRPYLVLGDRLCRELYDNMRDHIADR